MRVPTATGRNETHSRKGVGKLRQIVGRAGDVDGGVGVLAADQVDEQWIQRTITASSPPSRRERVAATCAVVSRNAGKIRVVGVRLVTTTLLQLEDGGAKPLPKAPMVDGNSNPLP